MVNLSKDAIRLYKELLHSDNPTQYMVDLFNKATSDENMKLRHLLKQLCENQFISIPMWADNLPWHIIVYDDMEESLDTKTDNGNIHIVIGDNNRITNSTLGNSYEKTKEKGFVKKHPILISVIVSFIVGFVLLFSFWEKLVGIIEGII